MAEQSSKAKVVVCKQDGDTEYQRLVKALSAFADVQEFSFADASAFSLGAFLAQTGDTQATFIDRELIANAPDTKPPGVTLFSKSALPLKQLLTQENNVVTCIPCISIQNIPLPDLMRICLSFVMKKFIPGVINLVDKGSLIAAEKIDSMGSVGKTIDDIVQFIEEERPTLSHRCLDLHHMIMGLTGEALLHSREAKKEYASVDIQISVTNDKAVFTLRFPMGELNFEQLPKLILSTNNLPWFHAWQGADILSLTEFTQFKELEVKAILFSSTRRSETPSYQSLLFQSTDMPLKSNNLLSSPKNYTFSLISDLQKNKSARKRAQDDSEDQIQDNEAPKEVLIDPTTKLKIVQLESSVKALQSQLEQKDAQVKLGLASVTEAKASLSQKRNELMKQLKEKDNNVITLQKQIDEFERKLASADRKIAELSQGNATATQRTTAATSLKTVELEKQQLTESLEIEKKKTSMVEAKFQQLKLDLTNKDKEIIELKQSVEKHKKDVHKVASAAAETQANAKKEAAVAKNQGQEKELQAKIRELVGKEDAYKLEIKKLTFKLENAEKASKGAHGESADKIKLLEKKLEEAKSKEIELTKKVDELSQAAKKQAKAA